MTGSSAKHAGSTTSTVFRYLGDTNAVSQETLTGATNTTKRYAYAGDVSDPPRA